MEDYSLETYRQYTLGAQQDPNLRTIKLAQLFNLSYVSLAEVHKGVLSGQEKRKYLDHVHLDRLYGYQRDSLVFLSLGGFYGYFCMYGGGEGGVLTWYSEDVTWYVDTLAVYWGVIN